MREAPAIGLALILMKTLAQRPFYQIALVFVVALAVRLLLVFTTNVDWLHGDGYQFHTLAVNLVRGRGYTMDKDKPFRPHFFREPGYPAFLASTYVVWELFGGSCHAADDYLAESERLGVTHPEIQFAKCVQAGVGAVTITLIFLSLALVMQSSAAFCLGLATGVYYPLALHCTYIWREEFLTLLVTLAAYCLARHWLQRRVVWLVPAALAIGLAMLTFQATILLPLAVFPMMLLCRRTVRQTLGGVILVVFIAFALCAPWIARAYVNCGSWKVARTLGASLTHEWCAAAEAIRRAEYYGLFESGEEFNRVFKSEMYGPESGSWTPSIDGHYLRVAAAWSNRMPREGYVSRRLLSEWAHFLCRGLVKTNWDPVKVETFRAGVIDMLGCRNFLGIALYSVSIVVGALSAIGLVAWIRELFPILTSYMYFMGLFWVLGRHERSFLPARYYLVTLACLGAYYMFARGVQRRTRQEIVSLLFLSRNAVLPH